MSTLYEQLCEKRKEYQCDEVDGEFEKYSDKERKVAEYLMKLKTGIISKSEEDPTKSFILREKFMLMREEIEKTELYKVLKKFPKGGLLHIHMAAALKSKFLYDQIKDRDDGYIFTKGDIIGQKDPHQAAEPYGKFMIFPPSEQPKMEKEGWKKIKIARTEFGAEKFDKMIFSKMYFLEKDEEGSSEHRWKKFQQIFPLLMFFFHKEVLRNFYFRMVESFLEDGIFYAEVSTMLGALYDSKGTKYTSEDQLKYMIELDLEAKKKYPGWMGGKIRHEDHKLSALEDISRTLDETIYFQTKYPNNVVGFDLVGEEDTGPPMDYFLPTICKKIENLKKDERLKFLFHAGESDRMNNNVLDCLLVESQRIGHGFNLLKSKKVMDLIKEMNKQKKHNICLEICPVSNKCLGYVYDGRSHPLTQYIREKIPFVISSDDPGIFDYEGVTHDYFFVFLGNLNFGINDLNVLKIIAKNSIQYSLMSDIEKKECFKKWDEMYQKFIDDVVANI